MQEIIFFTLVALSSLLTSSERLESLSGILSSLGKKRMWWSTKFSLVLTLRQFFFMVMVRMCGTGREGGGGGLCRQDLPKWETMPSFQRAYHAHPTCQQQDHISRGGCLCLRRRGGVALWLMLSPPQMEKCHSLRVYGSNDSVLHLVCLYWFTTVCWCFWTLVSTRKKKSQDKYFLTFLSFKVQFFSRNLHYALKHLPWYFSFLAEKVGIRAGLKEVEME